MDNLIFMVCGIYSAICIATGKRYVGSGYLVWGRIRGHIRSLNKKTHCNNYFQNAWNKYGGASGFTWELLEHCTRKQLHERETFWILHYRTVEPEFGFNIAFPIRQRVPSERSSKSHREVWQRPGMRETVSKSVRAYFAVVPDARFRAGNGIRRYFKDPKNLEKRSLDSARMWVDPEMRARLLENQNRVKASAEYRKRMSEIKRAHGADPAIRARVSASRKAQYKNDPEYVERTMQAAKDPKRNETIRSKAKVRWADPEFKARVGAAISAGKRAKKAEKLAMGLPLRAPNKKETETN